MPRTVEANGSAGKTRRIQGCSREETGLVTHVLAALMLALTVLIALGVGILAAYASISTILHLFAPRNTAPALKTSLIANTSQLAGD